MKVFPSPACTIIIFSLLLSGVCSGQTTSSSETTETLKQKIDTLLIKADEAASSNPDLAIERATQALKLSKKEQYTPEIARSHYIMGIAYTAQGDFEPALKNLNTALTFYTQLKDSYGIVLCKKHLGSLHHYSSHSETALVYYIEALDLAEKIKWEEEILNLINNIGTIHLSQAHYDKAIEYFQMSLNMNPDKAKESVILSNIGLAYRNMKAYDEALRHLRSSMLKCREMNDIQCELVPLGHMVAAFMDQKKYSLSLDYSYDIMDKQEKLGLRKDLMITYNRMGLIHWYQQRYDSAINYFTKSLDIARDTDYASLHLIHANLAFVYKDAGLYKTALDHLLTHQQLKDSLLSTEKDRLTEELLAKYDAEKQIKEIEILQKEKALQDAELERKALTQNVAVGGAALILIVSVVILINYQQKIKAQKQLSLKTEELNQQKKNELMRENEIKSVKANIEGQEKERERIAKELHDGIAGNLAGIKLILSNFSNKNNLSPELQKAIKNIDDTYHEVRTLSHHLIPPKIKENEFIELIKNYINDLSKTHAFQIHFGYHPKQELNQLPNSIKTEIYRVIQELMNNVIKHAEADQVDIQLTKLNESLNLMIEDNGKGFDPAVASKGIGLSNIYSRVSLLEGEINIDTTINRGTIVDITIPVIDN